MTVSDPAVAPLSLASSIPSVSLPSSSTTSSISSTSSSSASLHHHLHRSNSNSHVNKPMTWTQCLAQFIIVTTLVSCVVGIIGYSVDLYRHGKQKHYIGWFSSAGFVLLTIPISIRLIVMHLTHWNAPHIQKYVVRIIWMVPIYSIESWLALRFKGAAIYLETLRECYEAYVILCFMYYLMALLGDEHHINNLRQKYIAAGNKGSDFGRHSWPLNYILTPWSTGSELLQNCKFGVFQYVLIKNIFAVMVWTMHMKGHYNENKFNWNELYLYQCMVSNASQLWALYCLVMFYYATKEELTPWRPVGKFLCVKSVVFFTWWQSITIEFLIYLSHGRLFKSDGRSDWTVNEISKGLQVRKMLCFVVDVVETDPLSLC